MSYLFERPFHYEFIKSRGEGHQWRVGDKNDVMVKDFPCEVDAQVYVTAQNKR